MATPSKTQRAYSRYDTNVSVMLTSATMRMTVRMLSVSAGGALVRMDRLTSKVFEDETFYLEIDGVGRFPTSKKWRRDTDIGAKFELTDDDRIRLAGRLEDRFARRIPSPPAYAMPSAQF